MKINRRIITGCLFALIALIGCLSINQFVAYASAGGGYSNK